MFVPTHGVISVSCRVVVFFIIRYAWRVDSNCEVDERIKAVMFNIPSSTFL